MFSDFGMRPRSLVFGIVMFVVYIRAVMGTFAYHRIRREEDPDYRAARWWVAVLFVLPVFLFLLLFGIGLLSSTSVLLPAEVVDGDKLRDSQRQTLVDNGVLEPGEKIDLFYSAALASILQDGNFLTRDRIVSYEMYGDSLNVYSIPLDEVQGFRIVKEGTLLEDTIMELSSEEYQRIILILSSENDGDEKFISELESRTGLKRIDPELYTLQVVDGSEMSKRNINELRALGALRDGEQILFFYSEAWTGIKEAGNLLTDKRILSYDHTGEDGAMALAEAEFDDVTRVKIIREGQQLKDMGLEIRTKQGEWFYALLSIRNNSHEKFLSELLNRTGLELYQTPEYAKRVVDGNLLTSEEIAFLHEKGILQQNERVTLFFSEDILLEGYLLTEKRVGCYDQWDGEYSVYATPLDKVKAVWDWSEESPPESSCNYEIFNTDDDSFYISLPSGESGKDVFINMLLQRTGRRLIEPKPLMTDVQPGSSLAQEDIALLRSEGVLQDDEKVHWFYTSAYRSILNEGNILTDRRIVSYDKYNEKLNVYSTAYDKVVALWDATPQDEPVETLTIQVFNTDPAADNFTLLLPVKASATKSFIESLEQRTGEKLMRPEPCMTQVVSGADFPDKKLMALRTRGVMKPRERLDMLYSTGVKSFLESGCALTDSRVLKYADTGNDMIVQSMDFTEIKSLRAKVDYLNGRYELKIEATPDREMILTLPYGGVFIDQIVKMTHIEYEWEEME